jgi:hypothetical protein
MPSDFPAEVLQFLREHHLSPTRFGLLALNNGHFVRKLLEHDLLPRIKTVDRVRAFMAAYKPPKRART